KSMQEDKTFIQGSQDTTVTGAVMPQAHVPTARFASPAPIPQNAARAQAPPPAQVHQAGAMPPAEIKQGSSRGLYMVMGAVILMIVLVGAATYLPNRKQASAAEAEAAKQPVAVATTTNAPAATTTPAAASTAETQPASSEPAPAPKPAAKALAPANVPAQAAPAGPDPQAAALAAELDEIERSIDQLTGRAEAVNTGLDNLQRQQAAAGYGLRGDMAAKQSSMKVNLAKAQSAIGANDAVRAKRYAEQAARDVEALERFLGR
ncbi:MAG: hypothetical protein ABIP12_05930, partial [Terriglobales bacterium]